MTSLKPYPSYRKTDIPWLGQIPAHWEHRRIKFLCTVSRGASPRPIDDPKYFDDAGEYSWVRISDVTASDKYLLISEQRLSALGKSKSVPLEPGELFVSIAASVGKPIITGIKCCIHDGFVWLKGLKQDKEYFYYLLLSDRIFGGLGKTGTQLNLNSTFISDIDVPLPSLPEQRTIAAYLDHQTAKIDALIAKKERLLDLLAEQRSALISRAVTKGLNPDVKMKDSGVVWLGQVPRHWEVLHLRRVINKFVDYRGHTPPKVDDGIPLITARNTKNGKIDWELSQEYIPEELYEEWMIRGFPEIGDVLVTMEAPLGETAQITETHIALAQRIILLKADKTKIENDYLKYFLSSTAGQGELWSRATGSTAIGIKASHLKEIIILVPPIEEQIEIARVIRQEEKKIFTLIPKVETAIERLREYRAALISSAVTGKIQIKG